MSPDDRAKIDELVAQFEPYRAAFPVIRGAEHPQPFPSLEDLRHMAGCVDIARFNNIASSSRSKAFLKKLLITVARPLIKFLFHRQVSMNHYVWLMADRIRILEKRITELEKRTSHDR